MDIHTGVLKRWKRDLRLRLFHLKKKYSINEEKTTTRL